MSLEFGPRHYLCNKRRVAFAAAPPDPGLGAMAGHSRVAWAGVGCDLLGLGLKLWMLQKKKESVCVLLVVWTSILFVSAGGKSMCNYVVIH